MARVPIPAPPGSYQSAGDVSPTAMAMGEAVGSGTLLVVAALLAIVALVSIAGVMAARRQARQAARIARDRAHSMNELLRTVRMAESIADLGVWQFDPKTGEQSWSDGMRMIFGIDHHDEFVDGDADTLLFANDIDLVAHVTERQNERGPYTLRYDVQGFDGVPRSISVQACNLFGEAGALVRVIAVVRDVTDQLSRERELESSRAAAMREANKARELAETDPLTGLANRRRVMAEIDRQILQNRQFSHPMVLIVFDIDRFKSVNDTHGHIEGDKVIQRVAQIALNQARELDCVGRVGGEEFVWVVPRVNQLQAEQMAERLRQAVSHGSAVGPVSGVTISVGLAQLRPGDSTLTLFSRADNALYEAKEGGRNVVKLAA